MRPLRMEMLRRGALVALLACTLAGCSTYKQQNKIALQWRQSNLAGAMKEADDAVKSRGDGKDAIIWTLEQSTVLRAAGKTAESIEAFNHAEDRIDKYQEEAKTKLANEAGALLANQAVLPYRGRFYDGIMLNTYKALNHLQMNEPDKARVELNRAAQRQKDALEENKKRIEKVQDAVEKEKEKERIKKVQENEQFKGQVNTNYDDLDKLKAYGDYVNPFAVYLDGLFFMANSTSGSEMERARKAFQEVNNYVDNRFVKADYAAMEAATQQNKALPPVTYVIFETGCAPIREQIRIDLPIMLPQVPYVGAAFPRLKPQEDYAAGLTVTANGTNETTAVVCSMDSVIGKEFKNELPTIITKTIASTILKAAAAYGVVEGGRQAGGEWGKMAAKLAMVAYQASVNIADLRTWTTLPKEFQVCRIPTPPDRKIELATSNGGQTKTVTVCEGTYNIVYVRSITASGPLLISQIKLK